jgi:hypothetical protein
MAAKFCTKCGFEWTEGKRFCGRCGAAGKQTPQPVEVLSAAAMDASPSVPVQSAPPEPVVSVPVSLPMVKGPTVPAVPTPMQMGGAKQVPELRPDFVNAPEPVATQIEEVRPLERQAPSESTAASSSFHRFLAGTLVAILVVAAGALGFYEWHKKSPDAAVTNTTAQTQSSSDTLETPSSPQSVEKPDAGMSLPVPPTSTPVPAVESEAPAAPAPPIRKREHSEVPPFDSPRNPAPARSERVAPAPIVREAPASPKVGVLRYSGPPVHFGEVVTFSGLPGAMLRFSFDHASWQPRISHQPDGTQRLTLRSLTQQDQTQCEVRWEIAQ